MGSLWPTQTEAFFKWIQHWLIINTSWIYVLFVGMLLFFSLWLMLSRMGDIKLGPDHSVPEYKNISWFAMLFSAGMGIGLLFFGVAEPLMHFSAPPVGDPLTYESAREAMRITFFHWGLHAWAIYATVAVTLAYFCYRKNLPLLPRSAFYPFLGERVFGGWGHFIDTMAVIGTMFGVATSLGFGVAQVNAGLSYVFGLPQSLGIQVFLIAVITLMATVSVVLGLDGGIKRLSNINIFLAILIMLALLLLGDTSFLMKSYVQNTGAYLSDIVYKTFNLYAYEPKDEWIGGWTLLYWGWWVSWAPFVGMFIARISKGRTIREFMMGVLFVPTGFTFLWMTVFGNTAISIAMKENGNKLIETISDNVPIALFQLFSYFPFTLGLSILGTILVITFFVSSSDSGSLVIDTLASGGASEPPVWQRIYWSFLEGVVAAILLLAGGLDALQTMVIASAFPMIFLIFISCLAFIKALKEDYILSTSVQHHSTTVQYSKSSTSWKDRVFTLITHPVYKQARDFLESVVHPALQEVCEEFKNQGLKAEVIFESKDFIKLVIHKKEVEDFFYGVRLKSFAIPSYVSGEQEFYYRAEVFLRQGGQRYDIFGYTQEQVSIDAVTQYEKHLHYLHLVSSD